MDGAFIFIKLSLDVKKFKTFLNIVNITFCNILGMN